MCLFLWLVRREIVYKTVRNRWVYLVVPFLAVLVLWYTLVSQPTTDELVKGVLASLVLLSFLLDSRGLTTEGLVLNSFDRRGVPYSEINKVVLYQPKDSKEVKINFLERLAWPAIEIFCLIRRIDSFLAKHLNDDAELDIMIEHEDE